MFVNLLILLFTLPATAPHILPSQAIALPANVVPSWRWPQQAWTTKEDGSLHLLREELNDKYGYGRADIPLKVVNQYKRAFLHPPEQRSKLFQWGYAAYLLQTVDRLHHVDPDLLKALEVVKPPLSYEFMRMRYLLDMSQFRNNEYMIALGERLAQADPNDCDVRYYLAPGIGVNTSERKLKSLQYAMDMVRVFPERANGYSIVAHVYWSIWLVSHYKDLYAGRQAVHWNEEALKQETRPSKAEAKQQIQKQIDWLNKTIAETEKAQPKKQ